MDWDNNKKLYNHLRMRVGVWYRERMFGCLIRYKGNNRVIGFFRPSDRLNEWRWENDQSTELRLATKYEVKQALKKEALRRLFDKKEIKK